MRSVASGRLVCRFLIFSRSHSRSSLKSGKVVYAMALVNFRKLSMRFFALFLRSRSLASRENSLSQSRRRAQVKSRPPTACSKCDAPRLMAVYIRTCRVYHPPFTMHALSSIRRCSLHHFRPESVRETQRRTPSIKTLRVAAAGDTFIL
jgi:hypothetical protein